MRLVGDELGCLCCTGDPYCAVGEQTGSIVIGCGLGEASGQKVYPTDHRVRGFLGH